MKNIRLFSFLCAFFSLFSLNNTFAGEWVEGLGYKARLLMGEKLEDGTYLTALDVKLDENYITYWRNPGDHGIPPTFNFEQSENISKTRIHWPSPQVFKEKGSVSIGYNNRLVVPFSITPAKADEDMRLKLQAFIGVCAEICVPADIRVELDFSKNVQNEEAQNLIQSSLKTVPVKDETPENLADGAVLNKIDGKEFIDVQLNFPENAENITLLAEGPQDWYFSPVVSAREKLARHGGHFIARIPVYRDFPDDKNLGNVTLTMIFDNQKAIEKTLNLK